MFIEIDEGTDNADALPAMLTSITKIGENSKSI